MNYLMFVCADGMPSPDQLAVMQRELPGWIAEMDDRGVRLFGQELDLPETAVTVRVRNGETLVTDGPFAETKEFVAGFDLLDCADLDEAIEVASRSPVSWFQTLEIRPFADGPMAPGLPPGPCTSAAEIPTARLRAEPARTQRYALFMCLDGIPADDEVEASIGREAMAWHAEMTARGSLVYGHALASAETATTVRVRDGKTLICDGPFAETKEFIGGFAILDCNGRDEALELAALHPLAHHHMVEVRAFWTE